MSEAFTPPFDVRLMNATANVLLAAFCLAALAALAQWAANHRMFAIAGVSVSGELAHNNALTLRANVLPRLSGNFFTLDLAKARQAFETVPWVRRAVVQRVFPNRIAVQLQEHQTVAYWGAEDGSQLLDRDGEVFEANVGEVEQEALPRLDGPPGQAAQVLAMYRALQPLFASLELELEALTLSRRGSWSARLDSGAEVELGGGSDDEVRARTNRFLRTLTQVTSRYERRPDAVESADLRYADGYALRLRGVSTVSGATQKK